MFITSKDACSEVCNCPSALSVRIGEDPDIRHLRPSRVHFDKGSKGCREPTIALIAHVPGNISEGNWRAAVYLDDRVTGAGAGHSRRVHRQQGGPGGDLVQAHRRGRFRREGAPDVRCPRRPGNDQDRRRGLRGARATRAPRRDQN